MDYETTAADLEFQENSRPKSRGGLSKKEKQREKQFRKNRKQARGRKWLGSD